MRKITDYPLFIYFIYFSIIAILYLIIAYFNFTFGLIVPFYLIWGIFVPGYYYFKRTTIIFYIFFDTLFAISIAKNISVILFNFPFTLLNLTGLIIFSKLIISNMSRVYTKEKSAIDQKVVVLILLKILFFTLAFAISINGILVLLGDFPFNILRIVISGLSVTYGISVCLPYLSLKLNQYESLDQMVKGDFTELNDQTPNILYYIMIFSFSLIFNVIILTNVNLYFLLPFVYIPILLLSLQWGIIFAIFTTCFHGVSFSVLYSIILPGFDYYQIIFLQVSNILFVLISLFTGLNTSNIYIQKVKRTQSESQLLFLQKSQVISKMAGGLAHEVNNSNQIILGYAELILTLLKEDDQEELIEEYAQSIIKRSSEMNKLMKDMLTISKSRVSIKQPHNINELLTELSDILSKMVMKGINIKYKLDELPIFLIDKTHFEQVMINLVKNAKDAIGDNTNGEITITTKVISLQTELISVIDRIPPGDYIRIEIIDTGHGVDLKLIPKIFEPFYTTKDHQGTGLGLPIVRSLVHLNQGYINLTSEQGVGSNVSLYFDLKENGPALSQELFSSKLVPLDQKLKNVLLIEDEPEFRKILQSMLQLEKIEVINTNHKRGTQVITDLVLNQSDLVIIDSEYSNETESDYYDLIRTRHPRLPIVILHNEEDDIPAKFEIDPYLAIVTKPYMRNDIFRAINSIQMKSIV